MIYPVSEHEKSGIADRPCWIVVTRRVLDHRTAGRERGDLMANVRYCSGNRISPHEGAILESQGR
jgi:hypothetical protein